MEANNNHIDLIEKFLNNELSQEDKQAFDQKVHTDSEFAHEFERRQAAHTAIDFLIAQSLKKDLEALEAEGQQEGRIISLQKRKRNRIVLLSLAASLLLLFGYFSLYYNSDPGSTGPQLAAANYETPDYNLRRGAPEVDFEDLLTKGINALKQKEYQTAIVALDSVTYGNEYYYIAQFYLAHAYYQAEQYEQAEQAFEVVSQGNDIRYQEDADWYGLLACLAQDGDCTDKVDQLANDDSHSYQQQAVSIKDELK